MEAANYDRAKMGVKGLSDSGITSIPPIFICPPQALSDLKSSSTTATNIPTIDLSGLTSQTHLPKIINQIKQAAKEWGFFQVTNHRVPVSVLDQTIAAIQAFHDLPHETKSKYYKRDETRGVMYTSNNDLYRTNAACWHGSLQAWMGPESPKVEGLQEICREEVVAWDFHATGVAETVMELLCEGLGLEAGKFRELTLSQSRVLVEHCYPCCPQPDLTLGITPHTDPAILTVLLQNNVEGFQVKHWDIYSLFFIS